MKSIEPIHLNGVPPSDPVTFKDDGVVLSIRDGIHGFNYIFEFL
jgi:hypothetical protein